MRFDQSTRINCGPWKVVTIGPNIVLEELVGDENPTLHREKLEISEEEEALFYKALHTLDRVISHLRRSHTAVTFFKDPRPETPPFETFIAER